MSSFKTISAVRCAKAAETPNCRPPHCTSIAPPLMVVKMRVSGHVVPAGKEGVG